MNKNKPIKLITAPAWMLVGHNLKTAKPTRIDQRLNKRAPHQRIFEEVKEKSILIWESISDDSTYTSRKIKIVNGIENVGDGMMQIIAMFSPDNHLVLAFMLSHKALFQICLRLAVYGSTSYLNFFIPYFMKPTDLRVRFTSWMMLYKIHEWNSKNNFKEAINNEKR